MFSGSWRRGLTFRGKKLKHHAQVLLLSSMFPVWLIFFFSKKIILTAMYSTFLFRPSLCILVFLGVAAIVSRQCKSGSGHQLDPRRKWCHLTVSTLELLWLLCWKIMPLFIVLQGESTSSCTFAGVTFLTVFLVLSINLEI